MSDVSRLYHVEVKRDIGDRIVKGEYVAVAKSENRLRKIFKGDVRIIKSVRTDKARILIDLGGKEYAKT
jgi:hypothetical protein